MIDLLHSLTGLLEQGEDAALAAICLQSGSTPRTAGACMVVRRDGSILGTIGGGLVEGAGHRGMPQPARIRRPGPAAPL